MPIDVNCSAWKGFRTGEWRHLVNVRNFIQKNYTPYAGDESFLAPTSERTQKVWDKSHALILEELRKGILDVETDAISGINNFAPGYIDRDNEVIVGLQTDAPLKRIVNLYGGMRMAESALEQYGYKLNPEIEKHFRTYRKTHNDGVFDAYPHRTRVARTVGLLTGLPVRVNVSTADLYEPVMRLSEQIGTAAHQVLEKTPPELAGDIYRNGVVLTGGGAQLHGLPEYLSQELKVEVTVSPDPVNCVALGTAMSLRLGDKLETGFMDATPRMGRR